MYQYTKQFTAILITAAAILFIFPAAKAQSKENNFITRNTLYADFATRGAYYSVNYDRIFKEGRQFTKSYRAGFSATDKTIALPIGINFFTGHQASHMEISLTLVPYIDNYKSFLSSIDLSDKKMLIIPGVGYRYQKPEGGFFFRAVAAPAIDLDPPSDYFWKMDGKLYPVLTIGAGYSF
ncbi:MAG: hypothetical protein WCI49_13770 [Ferruginibacter sp.]